MKLNFKKIGLGFLFILLLGVFFVVGLFLLIMLLGVLIAFKDLILTGVFKVEPPGPIVLFGTLFWLVPLNIGLFIGLKEIWKELIRV